MLVVEVKEEKWGTLHFVNLVILGVLAIFYGDYPVRVGSHVTAGDFPSLEWQSTVSSQRLRQLAYLRLFKSLGIGGRGS